MASGLLCPDSSVHQLVQSGRLFSALRRARSEPLSEPHTGRERAPAPVGVCRDRAERDALTAQVLAELGACKEARALTAEPLACRPEPLPVGPALARAGELRRMGELQRAARLSARAVQAARAAGLSVRAVPTLPVPRRPDGSSDVRELLTLEAASSEPWQDLPSVYFLGDTVCVGGFCLLESGRASSMPTAEFIAGFAPRRFDYPWRMHPAQRLTANAQRIVAHATGSEVPLAWPASVVPDRFTHARIADLWFTRGGEAIWALSSSGRVIGVETRTGQPFADFDVASSCPRLQEPFRIVSAPSAGVSIAQVGALAGCATLIRTPSQSISALPFAPGSALAVSGNGRVVAVHGRGRVTSYELDAARGDVALPGRSFAWPRASHLALSYDGSVIAIVTPGKTVPLPDGADGLWPTELRLVHTDGSWLHGRPRFYLGYGGWIGDGDFGARVFSLKNGIYDYQGRLRAVMLGHKLAVFADGTLESFGADGRSLYRCAIGDERFPALDCSDAFERPGALAALVGEPASEAWRNVRSLRGPFTASVRD